MEGTAEGLDDTKLRREYDRLKGDMALTLQEVKEAQHEIVELQIQLQNKESTMTRLQQQHDQAKADLVRDADTKMEQMERRYQQQAGLDSQGVVDAVMAEKMEIQALL